MVTQQYTGLLAYYNQSYSIPNLKILPPPLELGLIKTKKEHSVSVVVFLMVGEGGAKIQRATSAAAPYVSASVVSSLSASTAEKVASNPARHVDTIHCNKKQCERTTNKVPPCYQCQRHVVCQSPKQQQQLEPYLAIRLSSAKPTPRTDNPSFTTGLAVTQGVQTPVKRQESPHLLYLPTGLMKKKQNRQ